MSSVLHIPFPTPALANTALRALAVDAELSPLVRRSLAVSPASGSPVGNADDASTLEVRYAATTHRMLRVAVNGFFESLGVVIGVMEELDVDVVMQPSREQIEGMGVQGLAAVKSG